MCNAERGGGGRTVCVHYRIFEKLIMNVDRSTEFIVYLEYYVAIFVDSSVFSSCFLHRVVLSVRVLSTSTM